MHREIGAIRQLPQHENIVQFLNVEEQEVIDKGIDGHSISMVTVKKKKSCFVY